MSFRGALPWLLYVFATCLPIIVAQTITPSDANSTVSRDRRFILATSLGGGMRLPLDPLTDEAGAAGDLQQFRVCSLSHADPVRWDAFLMLW